MENKQRKKLEELSKEKLQKLKSSNGIKYLDSKIMNYFRNNGPFYYHYSGENKQSENRDEIIEHLAPENATHYMVKESINTDIDWGYSYFHGSVKLRESEKYPVEYYLKNQDSFLEGEGI